MRLVAEYVGSRRCLHFKANTSMVACWGDDVWLDCYWGQEVLPILPQTLSHPKLWAVQVPNSLTEAPGLRSMVALRFQVLGAPLGPILVWNCLSLCPD